MKIDFQKNKKNLVSVGVFAAVLSFGATSYFLFVAPDNDRVLIEAEPMQYIAAPVPSPAPVVANVPDSSIGGVIESSMDNLENEPPTLDLSFTLPMSKDAKEILELSRSLSVETVRAMMLAEKSKGDKLQDKEIKESPITPSFGDMPSQFDYNNFNDTSEVSEPVKVVISEQVIVKGIFSVDGNLSAIIGLGEQVVPVRVGTKFNGVKVVGLNSTSITLSEGKKEYTRYLNKQVTKIKSNHKKERA